MNQTVLLCRRDGVIEHLFRLSLKASGYGFLVQTAHGRRGRVLQTETRTPERIPYDQALQLFTDLLAEKTAEGFVPVESDGTEEQPAVSPADRRYRPTCPTRLDIKEAGALIADPDWWLQEKLRGQHVMICKNDETIEAIGAEGEAVALPAAVRAALAEIPHRWILEGVCAGDTFTAFDQPQFENLDFRSLGYQMRLDGLRVLLPAGHPRLVVAETAEDIGAKVRLYNRLRAEGKAGVVLRKRNGVSRRGGLTVEGCTLACDFSEAPLPARCRSQRKLSRRDCGGTTCGMNTAL